MPVLANQRHEKFAQELAQGKTATEAYVLAGYRANRHNAARLKSFEHIGVRVLELQMAGARSAEISVASLLAELEEARSKATSLNQLSAAVRATAEKAKISGLLTQKVEMTVNQDTAYEDAITAEEIVLKVVADLGIDIAVGLAQLFKLHYDEAAIRSMAANAGKAGNGQQAIERRPNRSGRKQEIG